MGKKEEKGVLGGGWGGRDDYKSDEVGTRGSNKLLQATRRQGHWEVVGGEDRAGGRWEVPEMRGRGRDSGSHYVPVSRNKKNKGRER